jgi:AP endonuclease-1
MINKAHEATSQVVTVLENMAGAGNIIGNTFEDLRDIIAQVNDKSRVGVCIDTCHTFVSSSITIMKTLITDQSKLN